MGVYKALRRIVNYDNIKVNKRKKRHDPSRNKYYTIMVDSTNQYMRDKKQLKRCYFNITLNHFQKLNNANKNARGSPIKLLKAWLHNMH